MRGNPCDWKMFDMRRLAWSGVLLGLFGMGCGDSSASGNGGAGGVGGTGGEGVELCDGHATSGETSFTRRSSEWGLDGVVGGRVMSGDLNADGYPDLIVHGFAPNVREVKGTDVRRLYVLMNEASGSGRTFVDRTYDSGFAVPTDGSTTELKASHFAVLGDVDNDGDLDVFSGTYTDVPAAEETPADLDRSEIYLNNGDGTFALKANSGVAFDKPRRTSSATFSDVDRDGVLDLFVGVHYSATGSLQPPALFLGNGDGTFVDATTSWGVKSEKRATFGVASCDLDDNGYPELLMSAYARGPNVLYTLTESGFVDQGEASGYAFDENQDFSDNQFFRCWCTANETNPKCADVPPPSTNCPSPPGANWGGTSDEMPARLGGNTFSTVCSDIDGDGKLDLYDAAITHWWAGGSSDVSTLLLNQSTGANNFAFVRPNRTEVGLDVPRVGGSWNEGGIVAAVADLNGDARNDIFLGTSDYPDQFGWIFSQSSEGTFSESGESLGLHHPCAVGTTMADFDRDGDIDVVVASGTARDCAEIWETNEVHLYENQTPTSGSWLAIQLDGGEAADVNRAAVGARVSVEAGGVTQLQEFNSGYGHFGLQNDSLLHFRLGDCQAAASIEVVWPDASRSRSRFEKVQGGRMVRIAKGAEAVVDLTAPNP